MVAMENALREESGLGRGRTGPSMDTPLPVPLVNADPCFIFSMFRPRLLRPLSYLDGNLRRPGTR